MSVVPVAAVCTAGRLAEFLITRHSLEQYHACRWVVVSDPVVHRYLVDEGAANVTSLPVAVAEPASPRTLTRDVLLLKMHALRACIEAHGAAWHLDSDLLFVHPLPRDLVVATETDADVLVTEHHAPAPIAARFGRFNAGMLFTRSLAFVDAWRDATAAAPASAVAPDQVLLEHLVTRERFRWSAMPAGCNFGWWRFESDRRLFREVDLDGGVIRHRGEPIVNFHVHVDRRVRRPIEGVFAALVGLYLSHSTDPRHRDLLEKIRSILGYSLRE